MDYKTAFRGSMIFITVSLFFIGSLFAQQFTPLLSNRVVTNMNINWKFYLNDPTPPVGNPQDSAYNDASWKTVCLPCPFKVHTNQLDGSLDNACQLTFNRQIGWFRKHFSVHNQQNKKVYIVFQTVMQVATVYVNGKLVGTHERSGYDPFHFDITTFVNFTGDNVIAVKIDNNINRVSPPDDVYPTTGQVYINGMDFVLFGGINGDVALVCTDKLAIGFQWESATAGITITTPTASQVRVKVTVKNETTVSKTVTIVSTIVDAANTAVATMTSSAQTIAAGGSSLFTLLSTIPNAKLWSPASPYLYRLCTSVLDSATPVDSIWNRFGIRTISFNTTSGFYINGQPLKLIGVNRHSAWPFVGAAIPNTVHRREAQQIKSFGFNWIRLCHYGHDPEFLDALDEFGILALAEAPTWAHYGSAVWVANLHETLRRQIRRDKNHPCIMLWSAAVNHFDCDATLDNIVHSEDSTRPSAMCDVQTPHCWGAMNDPNSVPAVEVGGGFCDEHTGHTFHTPRFFTSYLSSSSLAWSNETRMLQHAGKHCGVVDVSRGTPANSGVAAWCMYDYNSFHNCGLDGSSADPRNHRNIVYHGLFDLYRIPKFAAQWYKSELTSQPMVFIANFWTATSPHDTVTVYSNCERVELFLNGVSKGTNTPSLGTNRKNLFHPPFIFDHIGWAPGTLVANGYVGTQIVANDTVRTPGAAARIKLETDTDTLLPDGADFARITALVLDANGTVVPTSGDSIRFSLSGNGTLIPGSVQNPLAAEAGIIITLVRSNPNTAGDITVSASSNTIIGATASITIHIVGQTSIENGKPYIIGHSGMFIKSSEYFSLCIGSRYILSPELSRSKNIIELYNMRGKLILRTQAMGLKSIELSKHKKAYGVFIVRILNKEPQP